MEAVLPIELEIPSLRIALESQVSEIDWTQARYDELLLLDEKRLRAAQHAQSYQRKMAWAFNKHVRPRNLKEGDFVLKEVRAPVMDPRGKFRPKWVGPYIIKTIMSERGVRLMDLDGIEFSQPTNLDQLKRYYA